MTDPVLIGLILSPISDHSESYYIGSELMLIRYYGTGYYFLIY